MPRGGSMYPRMRISDDTPCLHAFVVEPEHPGGKQDTGSPRDQPKAIGSKPVLATEWQHAPQTCPSPNMRLLAHITFTCSHSQWRILVSSEAGPSLASNQDTVKQSNRLTLLGWFWPMRYKGRPTWVQVGTPFQRHVKGKSFGSFSLDPPWDVEVV